MVAAVLRHLTVISRKDWQAKVGVMGYTDKCYSSVNFARRFHNTKQEIPDSNRIIMLYCPNAVCFFGFGLSSPTRLYNKTCVDSHLPMMIT